MLPLLLIIIVANSSPVLLRAVLKDRFNLPVDFYLILPDKHPLFGPSKTWRGIAVAILASALVAWLLGYSLLTGMLVGVYVMAGDLISSFIKRRLAMPSSSMAPLLDQVPESLLPAVLMMETFQLDIVSVILLVVFFILLEVVFSRLFYKLGIRQKPY